MQIVKLIAHAGEYTIGKIGEASFKFKGAKGSLFEQVFPVAVFAGPK
jgi:hypothetical protein